MGKGPEAAKRDHGGLSSVGEGSRALEPGEWAGMDGHPVGFDQK